MNIFDVLCERAVLGDRIAIATASGAISYRELYERVKAYVKWLNGKEVIKRGDRVVLAIKPSIDFYVALMALAGIGAEAVLIEPSDLGRAMRCLQFAKPQFILLGLRLLLPLYRDKQQDAPAAKNSPMALMTFTSGTSGGIKAIERSHDFLMKQAEILEKTLELGQSKIVLTTLPVFVLANLRAGLTSIYASRTDMKLPRAIVSKVLALEPDKIICAPQFAQMLAKSGDTASLLKDKHVIVGGAPLYAPVAAAIRHYCRRLTLVYGSSEAEPISHLEIDENFLPELYKAAKEGRGLPCGNIDRAVQLIILPLGSFEKYQQMSAAARLEKAPPAVDSEIGELLVAGIHVNKAYFMGIGEAENKLAIGETVFHRTGDTGYLKDGRLYLTGRKDSPWSHVVESFASLDSAVKRSAYLGTESKLLVEPFRGAILSAATRKHLAKANIAIEYTKLAVDARHGSKVLT
ncbi:MAG: AMP-binding protein [Candidatus Obscuribacter phosphatis]|uniref:AMP-binding protein n=1 Tax=Candidatus Obscuribacter phosphatis TaxID=1906157 RepID=A0A8J7PHH6_9BACT|nr:AMP-binding protein [Candidatus Obscuribacter phosphatis]